MRLSEALEYYLEQTEHERQHKSPTQVRILLNGRRRVITALIKIIGDKPIAELTRADALAYRDVLRKRVADGTLLVNSANRDLGHLRVILRTVCELQGLSQPPMDGLSLKNPPKRRGENREVLPFDRDWIQSKLLAENVFQELNEEARRVLYAMVETGLRPSEVVNILPDNIRLDHAVPHVRITSTEKRELKSASSERQVPLVGVSLMAFNAQPHGFPRYFDKNPQLSAAVNKFLKSRALLPSKRHRLYSLRHAFEDRLIASGMDYRVRKEIMGHQIKDMTYGLGASLEQVRDELKKIAFIPPSNV